MTKKSSNQSKTKGGKGTTAIGPPSPNEYHLRPDAAGRWVAIRGDNRSIPSLLAPQLYILTDIMDHKRSKKREQYFNLKDDKSYDGPLVVAEGDSWFEYPRSDDMIDLAGRTVAILSLARAGSTWSSVIYDEGRYYSDGTPMGLFETIRNEKPTIALLSVGGNDFLGSLDRFVRFYNDVPGNVGSKDLSALVYWKQFDAFIDVILANFTEYCRRIAPRPTIVSGYDYPNPQLPRDGGQWIGVALIQNRKFPGIGDCRKVVNLMVDRYMNRLKRHANKLGKDEGLRVYIVDYRGIIGKANGSEPEQSYWADELHASNDGAPLLTKKLLATIKHVHRDNGP